MKLVYTNENRFLVHNASNLLQNEGIEVVLKNEFAGGAMGEISAFDTWLELWVVKDSDYEQAFRIIESALSDSDDIAWKCPHCGETNDASFEVCWNCQHER